jgi:hypothetical protein
MNQLFWKIKDWIRGTGSLFGGLRSPQCLKVMKEYKKLHPACEISGSLKHVEPHHIFPVHLYPEKADDPTNFICLTRWLHFWLAHLGSWFSFNINIKADAEILKKKIENRPVKSSLALDEIYGK